jgi:hypothetical protein
MGGDRRPATGQPRFDLGLRSSGSGGLEGITGSLQFAVPVARFCNRSDRALQRLTEIIASATLFLGGFDAPKRTAVLQQHKGCVLVMRLVYAIGEVARGFSDCNRLFH